MSIVLDPSKSFVTLQIMFVEETDEKHGASKFHFINSRADLESWKGKGYLTTDELSKATMPLEEEKPGMAVRPTQDPKKVIQILRTWWSRMNWKEQNQIYSKCLRQSTNTEGQSRTELDMISYRDQKLKTCLKKWDLKDDGGSDIPLTETIIDSLVPEVAQELLNQFELITEATEEQLKN